MERNTMLMLERAKLSLQRGEIADLRQRVVAAEAGGTAAKRIADKTAHSALEVIVSAGKVVSS
ncbi:MAG: hypothetical protein CME40_05425 [Haliea sp.]|nr:hypothetical protein [Haliea sp.]